MSEKLQLDVQDLVQIANIIDQGLFVCDISGRIDYINPFACSFFGYDHAELIYRDINLLAPGFDFKSHFTHEHQKVDRIPARNKFGKAIFFNAKITPSPKIERYIVLISDITRRVEGQNKLMQKIDTCERLTRSRFIRDGQLDEAIMEIISESAKTLELERVNAWLIDKNFSLIECIGNYVNKGPGAKVKLYRKDMPAYFKLLETQEIIATDDTLHDNNTAELLESYIRPNGITSMMDVPIRIEGQMVGVVCFEHTGIPRKWDLTERKFGLFIAQLISLALETTERQNSQLHLEKSIREKELLLAEINHRVKNNLAMVGSLLNLQQSKASDDYNRELFTESKNRVLSIASIHQMLYQHKNFEQVDLKNYIDEIIALLKQSYAHFADSITINKTIDPISIDIHKAIPLGLIMNEIISNSFKHAFHKIKGPKVINVYLRSNHVSHLLEISDNGSGIANIQEALKKNTLGLSLIFDLAEQINAKIEYNNHNGSCFLIYFD